MIRDYRACLRTSTGNELKGRATKTHVKKRKTAVLGINELRLRYCEDGEERYHLTDDRDAMKYSRKSPLDKANVSHKTASVKLKILINKNINFLVAGDDRYLFCVFSLRDVTL